MASSNKAFESAREGNELLLSQAEEAVKAYAKPLVRPLGRMDAVTRKSGDNQDIDGEPAGSKLNIFQQWVCRFIPDLPFCSLDQ